MSDYRPKRYDAVSGCLAVAMLLILWAAPALAMDLDVQAAFGAASADEEDVVVLSVTVENLGPEDATLIEIAAALPAGLTLLSSGASHGAYDGGTGNWTMGALSALETARLTLVTKADAGTAGSDPAVTAALSWSIPADSNGANDSSVVSVHVYDVDFAMGKSVDDGLPEEGDTVQYTVTITNEGADGATGIWAQDLLPAGTGFVAATPNPGGTYYEGTGEWSVGSLAGGASATLTIDAAIQAGRAAETIDNTAEYDHSDRRDVDGTNDAATATLRVMGADLSVGKTDAVDPIRTVEDAVYTVQVCNGGPDAAPSVQLTDTLPAGTTFVSAVPTQGSCAHAAGIVTCDLGDLASAGCASVDITVTPGGAGTLVNEASAVSGMADPHGADNVSSEDTRVITATCLGTADDVTIYGARASGVDARFSWTEVNALCGYDIHRNTVAANVESSPPVATVPAGPWTDIAPPEALVFYKTLPEDTGIVETLTLNWTGEADPLCLGFTCDPGDGNGFADDGFVPQPVDPYFDGIANLALSGDASQFRVSLTAVNNNPPDYIDLLLDRNGDGDYGDPGEVIPLDEYNPGDMDLTDGKIYMVDLDGIQAEGTVPEPTARLYARDAAGGVRYHNGALSYAFRAGVAQNVAGGPAAAGSTISLLNTAHELVHGLGIPVMGADGCSRNTDWYTALSYFEEAEQRARPTSPYNVAADANRHPDYLDALMCAALAETGYVFGNYETLYHSPASKPYRDAMFNWMAFAQEQIGRMDHLGTYALSAPDTPWELDLPSFCIYLEDDPFAGLEALRTLSGTRSSAILEGRLEQASLPAGIRAPKAPLAFAMFGQVEWDRADAYMLKSLYHTLRAGAQAYAAYEDPAAANMLLVGDYDAIETWLTAEEDAEARALNDCPAGPCPMNGVDDDGDTLADDLGYAARLFETYDGLGVANTAGGVSLLAAGEESSDAIDAFREGFRLVLAETDDQSDEATLYYEDANINNMADFNDTWSYSAGGGVPDGLPDLSWDDGDYLPDSWCPVDPDRPEDVRFSGALGDDFDWLIDQAFSLYEDLSGEDLDEECYPNVWAVTVFAANQGYDYQRAVAGDILDWRTGVEEYLNDQGIDPDDLGPEFEEFLIFLETIDFRSFLMNPDDIRALLPYFCTGGGCAGDPARGAYALNGFYGDLEESTDPIVAGEFWTMEPYFEFNQNANGILVCSEPDPNDCDLTELINPGWIDEDGDNEPDIYERVAMASADTPVRYLDLNGDGQWNGWTDRSHTTVTYAGEPAEPGRGYYNSIYVYWQDTTFGGRIDNVSNERLNTYLSFAFGLADGLFGGEPSNFPPVAGPVPISSVNCAGNECFTADYTDPDGDTLHYHLILPDDFIPWGGSVVSFDPETGQGELDVPAGTWGFILVVYDNVNNLLDAEYHYWEVTR